MNIFHFGTFFEVLYRYAGANLKAASFATNEADLVYQLLEAAGGEVFIDEGKKTYQTTASKYRNGKLAIKENLAASFRGDEARYDVRQFMKYHIAGAIPRGKKEQLIKDYLVLISADDSIDKEFKAYLESEAQPESLSAFLADLLIYAVQVDPTEVETKLTKLAGPALTVLIDEAVPELIKTILSLFYVGFDENSEATQALKNNDFSSFIQICLSERRMSAIEFYRWSNYFKIAGMANTELLNRLDIDERESRAIRIDANYDIDWHMRFFEASSQISNEEMQRYWAKLLAGEMAKPGSFSLRTIEALKSISPEEARTFDLMSFDIFQAVDGHFFFSPDGTFGYGANALADMQDAGLFVQKDTVNLTLYNHDPVIFIDRNNYGLSIFSDNDECELKYEQYVLTKTGREILTLVDREQDWKELCVIGKEFARKRFKFKIYKMESLDFEDRNHKLGEVIYSFPEDEIAERERLGIPLYPEIKKVDKVIPCVSDKDREFEE